MKKIFPFLLLLFSLSCFSQTVKVYIYTNTTPSAVTVTPATLKFDKTSVFMLSLDDDNKEGWNVFKNALKYHYTDGAGKSFTYPIEYALNAMNSYNNNELIDNGYNSMTFAQLAEVMKQRCTFSNHGFYHFPCSVKSQPGWENAGCADYLTNIIQNEQYFYRKFGERGIPLSSRIWTNPSDDTGYYKKADSLGYLATSSQGSTDNSYIVGGGPKDIQAGGPVTIPTINAGFKLYRRDFSDAWENDYNARIKGYLNTLLTTSNTSTRKMYRIGSHLNANAILYIDTAFQFIQANSNDNCWITTTQEFEEYAEIKRIVEPTKTVSINGNVTVVTYDFTNVPDKNRFRDMSLLVNVTGATMQKVLVTGVDEYTFNTTKGLINFYSEKRGGYSRPYGSPRVTNATIPLTPDMVVVDGFNSTSKEEYLVDNSSNYFSLGASTFATDTVDVYLETDPFGKRNIKLNKVRFYDGANDAINNPALFYGVKKYGGQSVLLATFNGADYLAWKETAVTDTSTWKKFYLRKLHVNDQANYSRTEPGKIELVGDYNNDSIYFASYIVRTKPTFRTMNGANNDWSKVGKPSDMKQKSVLFPNAPKMSRNRFYLDMCQHFYPGDSTWFNYYDSVFKWVSESGSDINVCLKSMPVDWVQANYPQTINGNNIWPDASSCLNVLVPAPWGTDWTDPNNYRKIAEYCFQIAGRYGHNANISESLRKSKKKYTGGTLIQPWQDADAPVWGLGYVKYMSPGNENDKSWFPDRRWILQKGDELMAEMSACYDGNMGAMGPGVGIKTADPTMIVLPPAYTEAGKSDNYLRIGRKWVIEHRGYKADGVTPNWPFDEMDFHNYSSDVGGQHNQTTGKAHEKSVAFGEVDTVLKFLGAYANSMPANITETGYDTKDTVLNSVRQGTIQNVPFISGKTVYETQADLNSRMALVNWAKGISAIDFYQMYDDDDANRYLSLYGSCGLFFSENQGYWSGVNGAPKNKPSGNFVVQLKNLLGDYVVDTLNRAGDLWTIKAVKADTTKYIVWMGTENGSTQAATLPITQGVKYDLDYNSETPSQTNITSASVYNFTATEKPAVFLVGPAPAGGNGNGNGFGWKKHFAAKRGKKIVVRQVF